MCVCVLSYIRVKTNFVIFEPSQSFTEFLPSLFSVEFNLFTSVTYVDMHEYYSSKL